MPEPTLKEMIEEMRPLLATEGTDVNFRMPSLLRDIPSYTSDHTGDREDSAIAQLRGYSSPNL